MGLIPCTLCSLAILMPKQISERDNTVFNGMALRLGLCRGLGLSRRLRLAHLGQLLEGTLVHCLVLSICSGRLLPVALLQRSDILVAGLHLRFAINQCWCNDATLLLQPRLPIVALLQCTMP